MESLLVCNVQVSFFITRLSETKFKLLDDSPKSTPFFCFFAGLCKVPTY